MRIRLLVQLLLLVFLVLTGTGCATSKQREIPILGTEDVAEEFSCYALFPEGEKIYGFEREADGKWYLFVPYGLSLEDMEVYFTANVVRASQGELDEKKRVLTHANFSDKTQLEFESAEGKCYTVVVIQSDLPSVQISLNDTTLELIHADKDQKHKNNTFILTGPDNTYNLTIKESVEVKGRGNTTWTLYDKKGYQIKFADKTSVLGMGEAKKWVLLANASDDSMIRTQLVSKMADKLDMAFVPSFEYVDLWIGGEYLGTYLLGEKVELGESRLGLTQPDGAIFEHDEGYYSTEKYWLYSEKLQRHFTMKEILTEEDAVIETSMNNFEMAVDKLASYLYSTPSTEVSLEALATMIDVDSFAKYYLINEYVLNKESCVTSFYWYKDGVVDVLHLGPIWDFDTCMGNDGTDYTENYLENHVLFRYLLAVPEFKERTEALYDQYREAFVSMKSDVQILKGKLSTSAEMNYLRWDVLGKATVKKDAVDFYDTFEEAVGAVETWLVRRENNFQIADCKVITSEVSKDYRTMEVFIADNHSYETVHFAVWNVTYGTELVEWYTAQRTEGVWHATVDLTDFEVSGMYHIGVHVDNEPLAISEGWNYVEKAAVRDYRLQVRSSEDSAQILLTLKDNTPCRDVSFVVWSDEDGQDDLQWLDAQRNPDGEWYYAVDLSSFNADGVFHIHAYEMANSSPIILEVTTFYFEKE